MNLRVIEGEFSIAKVQSLAEIPAEVWASEFVSLTKTARERSLVYPSSVPLKSEKIEPGWSAIEVVGPLDFALVGILSTLLAPLAADKISVFVVSTFDTDFILVKTEKLEAAVSALLSAGHEVEFPKEKLCG